LIRDIHPSEIVHIFQKNVAKIWTIKWTFVVACAQRNVRESINLLIGKLWALAIFYVWLTNCEMCLNYLEKFDGLVAVFMPFCRKCNIKHNSWFHVILVCIIMVPHCIAFLQFLYEQEYCVSEWKTRTLSEIIFPIVNNGYSLI